LGTTALLFTALAGLSMGCDSLGPGDYVIYRVAIAEGDQSDGCYFPLDDPPPNVKNDSSTLRSSANFILYAGADESYYLDLGQTTLEGTVDSDTYSFSGKIVDVEYTLPDGDGDKLTTTVTTSVNMTVDGNAVSGSLSVKTSFSCKGSTCGDKIPSCTVTNDFVGSEIDEIELEHSL
jgi:hypothetical protein